MSNEQISPCLDCGACCAFFRVSFYWAEATDAPGGWVPVEFTEQLSPYLRCMSGTSQRHPHCQQLQGEIPGARCGIYPQRPSTCHELEPYEASGEVNDQCARARAFYGLPALEALPSPLIS